MVSIPDAIREHKDLPCAILNLRRDTTMGAYTGLCARILDDSQGNTWVMKSAGLIVAPNQQFENLKDPGSRLKVPAGWKFRSPVLEQDLVFMTGYGKTMITEDELDNTFDRVGDHYSNYTPWREVSIP